MLFYITSDHHDTTFPPILLCTVFVMKIYITLDNQCSVLIELSHTHAYTHTFFNLNFTMVVAYWLNLSDTRIFTHTYLNNIDSNCWDMHTISLLFYLRYTYTNTHTYLYIYLHLYICYHLYTHTYTYVSKDTHTHTHTHVHVHTHAYTHIHTHTHAHSHTHTHTHTHIFFPLIVTYLVITGLGRSHKIRSIKRIYYSCFYIRNQKRCVMFKCFVSQCIT